MALNHRSAAAYPWKVKYKRKGQNNRWCEKEKKAGA